MIEESLVLLRGELEDYIRTKDPSVDVKIDNIGLFETQNGQSLDSSVILTLVNIEEESTLKNQSNVKRGFNDKVLYRNSPVYLNLYVLVTCNYSGADYNLALRRLTYVIQFIQSKTSFSTASSVSGGSQDKDEAAALGIKFTLELYTLTFEQINHLWGSLGGRQIPFAMYKLRLVAISERAIIREIPIIEQIDPRLTKMPDKVN